MDFIFISMPYARFVSRWFANVPNINLGIMQSYLKEKGKKVKTFHFHLEFLPYLNRMDPRLKENLLKLTEQYGVEYMGLDYIFASIFFDESYQRSKENFGERLEALGLNLKDFDELRQVAQSFIESAFDRLSPYIDKTRLIGFSCSHYQLSGSLLLCSKIKSVCPDALTVFGGKDCTGAFGFDLMKNIDCVDFVGTTECEVTVASLLEHMSDDRTEFFNLLFRNTDGEITKAQSMPNVPIDSLPFPEYDFNDFPLSKSDIILPIEFGRGCPWKRCTFCPDESYNILCQIKSPERVKTEIEYYLDISDDLRNFFIVDSDTLKDPKTIIEISRYLEEKNLNFIYAEFRAERMDRKVLNAILRFGQWTSHFQIGIETFSERMLRLMNKGVTVMKNVEVLKSAVELKVPVQFNLFTCYPGMTAEDLRENLRVMDLIAHILVKDNIQIYPGEFYLPTDSPVFLNSEKFGLRKSSDSIFSSIFQGFGMPSYSNYPYPYQFDNDDAQYGFSMTIRDKVGEIKSKTPEDTYMIYKPSLNGLDIEISRNGLKTTHTLDEKEKKIYLSAVERSLLVTRLCEESGLPQNDVSTILDGFEQKGLILFSPDRKSFLSLATKT